MIRLQKLGGSLASTRGVFCAHQSRRPIGRTPKPNWSQFIAFPESFLPGFPIWAALWAPIENHSFFRQMVANSILVDGQEMQRLQQAARTEGVFVDLDPKRRNLTRSCHRKRVNGSLYSISHYGLEH